MGRPQTYLCLQSYLYPALSNFQVVTPADGGEYIIDSFGPRLIQTTEDHVYPVT